MAMSNSRQEPVILLLVEHLSNEHGCLGHVLSNRDPLIFAIAELPEAQRQSQIFQIVNSLLKFLHLRLDNPRFAPELELLVHPFVSERERPPDSFFRLNRRVQEPSRQSTCFLRRPNTGPAGNYLDWFAYRFDEGADVLA